jgi:alpha-1,2-mannosyltransferase
MKETNRGLPLFPWGLVGLVTFPMAAVAFLVFGLTFDFVLFGDAEWYAAALPALLSNQPLYDPSKFVRHPLVFPHYWNQPPSTALVSLVQLLPGDRWLWGGLMVGCVLVGLLLIWPRVGPGGSMLLAPVILMWHPVTSALIWANVNSAVFLLLAIALRYPRAAGTAIGIAAAIKLVPVLGVAWLVGKRDWRGAATAVAILVAATLIIMIWKGPTVLADFVRLRLNEFTLGPGSNPRWNPVEWFALPDWVAYLAGALIAIAAAARASYSLSIIAMLASVPSLHGHYLIWLLIPILCIWIPWVLARSRRRDPQRRPAAAVTANE